MRKKAKKPANNAAPSVNTQAKFRLTDADLLDSVAKIRRGLAQALRGEGRPAEEVFDELEREG
jgi:hypothetical protein